MANTTKVTKREVINAMLADENINTNDLYVGYLTNELALLDKKSASRKPSKTQEENKVLFEVIAGLLTSEGQTVSEIKAKDESLAGLSTQKVSALLKIMTDNGSAVKVVDKKKALFFAPEDAE